MRNNGMFLASLFIAGLWFFDAIALKEPQFLPLAITWAAVAVIFYTPPRSPA